MNRRRFGSIVGTVLLSRALPSIARPNSIPRIGWIGFGDPDSSRSLLAAFWQGMKQLDYEEGRNVIMEYRWGLGSHERNPALARELVQRRVDLLLTGTTAAAQACRAVTRTIPIICFNFSDPVADKLAASLGRPGGNVTGMTVLAPELVPKQLSLLKAAVPRIKQIAGIWQPGALTEAAANEMLLGTQGAALASGTAFRSYGVRAADNLDGALDDIRKSGADALLVMPCPVSLFARKRIGRFIAARRLPAAGWIREFVQVGALLSYGVDFSHQYRVGAAYVAKVLRGADPATLPIEQPTKFELIVNLRSARALGVAIPPLLQIQADEVID